MAYKHSLEALNWTLQDFNNSDKLFGSTILLLSGDFQQTLPVIPRCAIADKIVHEIEFIKVLNNIDNYYQVI